MAAKNKPDSIVASQKAIKEATARHKAALEQRNASPILLDKSEIETESYDFSRALDTTLGTGAKRKITGKDLQRFQTYIKKLQKHYKGGITAQQVIDQTTQDRRQRAHQVIRQAVPLRFKGGRVQFQTNTSARSKHNRHYVVVEFMDYEAFVEADAKLNPITMAKKMCKGKIKIDCSCEDWRYRYRYMATIGRYAGGAWLEHAYPKITNPQLDGLACMHVVRTMIVIAQSPNFTNFAARMIAKGRESVERKEQKIKVAEMRQINQAIQKENWRQRAVQTSGEKAAARALTKQQKADRKKIMGVAAKKAAQRKAKITANPERQEARLRAEIEKAKKTIMLLPLTVKQKEQAMKNAEANLRKNYGKK